MTTVYPSSDGYFQEDNEPCHKAQIISDWFLEHDNEFTLLKWPPHSPDLNPIEQWFSPGGARVGYRMGGKINRKEKIC